MTMQELMITEESIEKSKMIYLRRKGAYGPENAILMEEFKRWVADHDYMNDDAIILGIAWDNAALVAPEECRYDVCLVGNYEGDVDKIQKGESPCGKYAVIQFPHTAEAVTYVWQKGIPHLMGMGYQLDYDRPIVERYRKKMVDQGWCEMLIPVKKCCEK